MKRVVDVELGDESLAVTYDRDALIEATAEGAPAVFLGDLRLQEGLATFEALVAALVSWDLTYDDGRPYPTDREAMSKLPFAALWKIGQSISADAFEGD